MKWREAIAGFVATLIIWEILSLILARPVLPPPTKVLVVFFSQIGGQLGRHLLVSAGRVTAAILLATLLAVPAGMGLGQMKSLDRFFSPSHIHCLSHPEDCLPAGDPGPLRVRGRQQDTAGGAHPLFPDPGCGSRTMPPGYGPN